MTRDWTTVGRDELLRELRGAVDEAEHWAARNRLLEDRIGRAQNALRGGGFNLADAINEQRDWSTRTFGPGERRVGIMAHIRKELDEIAAAPDDVEEWVDLVLLALDGAWRSTGCTGEKFVAALQSKIAKNRARTWPDWRTRSEDDPIEHVRETP